MDPFLEELADTAEEVAAEQRQVAREARVMQRDRDRGGSWVEVLDRQGNETPRLLVWMRSSAKTLALAISGLTRGLAVRLNAEGQSRRAIARRLGVTHQRVSTILRRGPEVGPPRP